MKLNDFEIFNKFRNTMAVAIDQFYEVNDKDYAEIAELQTKLDEVTNHRVSPELYNKIKAVFGRVISMTFGSPESEYVDYDYFDMFRGFVYRPIVPYTSEYVVKTEKDDFFEISKYNPEIEEMIEHIANLLKPKTIGLFKSKVADSELFIEGKIEQAKTLESKKYRFWERKKKQEDEIYARALRTCAYESEPFKNELKDIVAQLEGTEKKHLGAQAREVYGEYLKSKKEFDEQSAVRRVIAGHIKGDIAKIYQTVIERCGFAVDANTIDPTEKDALKGYELSVEKKMEIASVAITSEEIEALKADSLFILAFYDAVANKGELQGTESDRFVAEFLVHVLQKRIEEVLAFQEQAKASQKQ